MNPDIPQRSYQVCCSLWAPPERLKPSEWAAKHRHLTKQVSAEPGRWRNKRTPYLVGIMDVVDEPGVEEAVLVKCVQVGGSEAGRNNLGAWIDQEPGPCMMVLPDEKAAREVIEERVMPLLTESPNLKRHISSRAWDTKSASIKLDTMSIYVAWAGGPQTLASRPIRYVDFDEIDKYPRFSGRDADPLALGSKRTTTYGHRRFIWKRSTPTIRAGNIWRAWEACADKRHYHVPCPHCGEHLVLDWSHVKYPKLDDEADPAKRADRIKMDDLAYYECQHCCGRITDGHKPKMLPRGLWLSEGQTIDKAGIVTGDKPRSKRVGLHINSLYSPWVRFSEVASEFIEAQGDAALMMAWRNNHLALPFEEQASKTKPDTITAKTGHAGKPLETPAWAGMILASADVQKDHIWYVIRAWGHGSRSQLLGYGIAVDFEQLRQMVFERGIPTAWGEATCAQLLSVDCRYRSDEVFRFAATDPARIIPVSGNPHPRAPQLTENKVKGYTGVIKRSVNPNFWKNVLHGYIHADDITHWLPHADIGDDYIRQMTSEHKIHDPKSNLWTWVPLSRGADNHLWDCEAANCMLAQIAGVEALPTVEEMTAQHAAKQNNAKTERANPLDYKGKY